MSSEVGLRVTVWGKRLEREKPEAARIYPDGIHETVASALRAELGGTALVRTATLDAPEHGRTSQVLRETDVLAWWSHRAPGGRNETWCEEWVTSELPSGAAATTSTTARERALACRRSPGAVWTLVSLDQDLLRVVRRRLI